MVGLPGTFAPEKAGIETPLPPGPEGPESGCSVCCWPRAEIALHTREKKGLSFFLMVTVTFWVESLGIRMLGTAHSTKEKRSWVVD